ncbi:MAG: hypothetical protein HY321_08750 [Armatimonadetes bacterium]|nr:hypothetical protein [Armatimonadota bacterium]
MAIRKPALYSAKALRGEKTQRAFSGTNAVNIALPLGGIGAGCICLNGVGGLQDFSIRHRPQMTAMPEGQVLADAAFALLRVKGKKPITRLVEGPFPPEKKFGLGMKGGGYHGGGHEGMPRFAHSTFRGEYPFGTVSLADPKVPLRAQITGFSPFIPLDDRDSGLPCAILEYTLENPTKAPVDYEFSFHLLHPAPGRAPDRSSSRNTVIPGAGVFLYNEDPSNAETFGSASLTVVGHPPVIKGMWFRGEGFDSVSVLWREVSEGRFTPNDGSNGVDTTGRNGGSVLVAGTLAPGASVTYPVVIAWHFPNSNLTVGHRAPAGETCACAPGECDPENPPPKWRPYYASQWQDARAVAEHVHANYDSLRARTRAFHEALFSSTLPSYVLDAISANLAILKSPTVLRQENGNVWGWEGCTCAQGCCAGTCTHVWNYAQAMPHLFPRLERTLREQELERSIDERGHVAFRAALPDGPARHTGPAAADGQLGGIMKLYRDWQISGDREWLARLYPLARRSLDYCADTWDPDRRGVLVEPHHNTYDIEFWGADGMCSSIYLGALAAMAALARDLGRPEDAAPYQELAERGARYLDQHLFNGDYYEQKVAHAGLRDTSFAEQIAKADDGRSEVLRLLRAEGPKYQYGSGCLSDGVIGAWMARIYGIETPQSRARVRKNLRAIFRHNFKPDLSEHACTQRPGYAWGPEPGLLLCTWPRGGKPSLPFIYSDEVWTGIEYQVASHLIEEGMVKEGLTLVRALRSRYDGRARNPWDEYECGHYYARAMASYALLGSLAGFRYSAATKTLFFGPKLKTDPFRAFFCTATGYGTLTLSKGELAIRMVEGELPVDQVCLTTGRKTREISWGVVAQVGKKAVKKV